jgi:hypothetical protein
MKQVEETEKFEASYILPALSGDIRGTVLGGLTWGCLTGMDK